VTPSWVVFFGLCASTLAALGRAHTRVANSPQCRVIPITLSCPVYHKINNCRAALTELPTTSRQDRQHLWCFDQHRGQHLVATLLP
jgi:hypothetical protein